MITCIFVGLASFICGALACAGFVSWLIHQGIIFMDRHHPDKYDE